MQIFRKIISIVSLVALMVAMQATTLAQQAGQTQPAPAAAATPAAPASAPSSPAEASPAAPAAASPSKAVLKEGTEVSLKLVQNLSSKTARVGDPVDMTLDQDLLVGQTVVVKKGAKALATITNAKKAGMMGRGGELNLHLEYLLAEGGKVRLRGVQGHQGDDKTGATVGLVIAFGVLGFMKHGKQAEVKEGTALKAYVDQDIELAALPPSTEATAK